MPRSLPRRAEWNLKAPAVSSNRSNFVLRAIHDGSLFQKPTGHIPPTKYAFPEVNAAHVAAMYAATLWYVTRTASRPRG